MEQSPRVAELVGIILGDGNIYVNRARGIYALRITLGLDEREFAEYVFGLVRDCLNVSPKLVTYSYYGRPSELVVLVYSRRAVDELLAAGLLAGNKTKNRVGIPGWIFSNNEFLRACVRGLMDTDGCIYGKYKYATPQLEFYSQSPPLLADFQRAVALLGFQVSRVTAGKRTTPKCGIYSRSEVARYCRDVGFVNFKYVRRLNRIQALVV